MKPRQLALGVVLLLASTLLIAGVGGVPFHPDETSLLFQSRDFEALFRDPLSLAHNPGSPLDRTAAYRALNAPLPKYVLGAGRSAASYGPDTVDTDWRWEQSWQRNLQRGALPPAGALLGARIASTVMLVLALITVYLIGKRLGGWPAGLIAAALLGTNPLTLIHGRRAMAEGTLLLAVGLAVLAALDARRRPWLAGLAAAVALGSKHSTLPLVLVGYLAAAGLFSGQRTGVARRSLQFVASFMGAFWLLNPFLWRAPLAGLKQTLFYRADLLARQVEATQALAPHGSLDQVSERLAALIGHLFILPPQLQEVANYEAVLQPSFGLYLSQPMHSLLRGPWFGGLMFALFLAGLITTGLLLQRGQVDSPHAIWTLAAATLLQGLALLANPLPVQRYYIPLLPLVSLWQALALVGLGRAVLEAFRGRAEIGSG